MGVETSRDQAQRSVDSVLRRATGFPLAGAAQGLQRPSPSGSPVYPPFFGPCQNRRVPESLACPSMLKISAPSSNRSRIAVAAGTSPSRAPHSSMGRLLIISVERLRCRRTMFSSNASAPLGGKLFMPKSSRHSRSGFKYRANVRRVSAEVGSACSSRTSSKTEQ